MLGEPQIGDDLGIEQGHRVGGDRIAEAGMELFRHGRAADDGRRSSTITLSPAIAR